MKNIAILSNSLDSVLNYRSELIVALAKTSQVFVIIPKSNNQIKLKALDKLGVKVVQVIMSRKGMNPFSEIYLCIQFLQLFKSHKIDVVFPCRIKPVIWGSLAARILKIKCVPFITGLGYTFISVTSLKKKCLFKLVVKLYKSAFKRCETIIFQNKDDCNLLCDLGIVSTSRTKVVNGSGVNCDHFFMSDFAAVKPPHFLMVSRLLLEKGVVEYCAAARVIKEKYNEAKFTLVGFYDGSMSTQQKAELETMIAKAPINFVGKIEDVRPYIEACSVFVLPSYREGTPRATLEAMAMGRAVITTDVPGCRGTVVDGVNGYRVVERCSKSLAQAMEKFCLNPSSSQGMGAKSREIVLSEYDVHQVNREIMLCLI